MCYGVLCLGITFRLGLGVGALNIHFLKWLSWVNNWIAHCEWGGRAVSACLGVIIKTRREPKAAFITDLFDVKVKPVPVITLAK